MHIHMKRVVRMRVDIHDRRMATRISTIRANTYACRSKTGGWLQVLAQYVLIRCGGWLHVSAQHVCGYTY